MVTLGSSFNLSQPGRLESRTASTEGPRPFEAEFLSDWRVLESMKGVFWRAVVDREGLESLSRG